MRGDNNMNLRKYALALVLTTTLGSLVAAPGTQHEARYTDLLTLPDSADNPSQILSVLSVAPDFSWPTPTAGGVNPSNTVQNGSDDVSRFSIRGNTIPISNGMLFGASLAGFFRAPVNSPTMAGAGRNSIPSLFAGEILGLPESEPFFDAPILPASDVIPIPRAAWLLGCICLVGLVGITRLIYTGFS